MKQFLSWEGRMNRASFFKNSLLVFMMWIAGGLIFLMGDLAKINMGRSAGIFIGMIGLSILICTLLRNMAITSRRLHDLNLSGMLVLPYFVVSGLAGKIEGLWVIGLLATLALLLLPGNKTANQYGDVPGKVENNIGNER